VKRHDSAVPGGAALALRKLAVSRPEAIVLAAVAAMLVPLLMLEGGAFRLPSLLERGVEFLIPGLADGNARGEPAVLPSRTGTLAGVTAGAAVVLAVRSAPASRGGISVASGTSLGVTGSRGARAASVTVKGVAARVPAPGVTGTTAPTDSPPPPTAGPGEGGGGSGAGGGPGHRGPGTPAVTVGVDATASVGIEAGPSSVTGTATVSTATPGVSVTATVADVAVAASAAAPTDTGAVPTASVTLDPGQVALPDTTVTVAGVAVSTAVGLTPA
jgi:hypothetical protein